MKLVTVLRSKINGWKIKGLLKKYSRVKKKYRRSAAKYYAYRMMINSRYGVTGSIDNIIDSKIGKE